MVLQRWCLFMKVEFKELGEMVSVALLKSSRQYPHISLINSLGHLVLEGDQAGQVESAFHKPIWLGLILRLFLTHHVKSTQDDLLHNLA